MLGPDQSNLHRRGFLQTGALATASALAVSSAGRAAEPAPAGSVLPRRKLGKTGVDVTILNLGTWRGVGLDRLLRFAYSHGIRYYDAAASYGSEPFIGRWLQAMPEVRKEIFLATKDHPRDPKEMLRLIDQRLAALRTDHLDLYFYHALGDGVGAAAAIDMLRSKNFRDTVDALKKSGKTRFVGFSTHHPDRAQIIQAAAEEGVVDVIMLQFTPWLDKDSALNKALDAAHKAGIGLISMKQVAGNQNVEKMIENANLKEALKEQGLSPFQGLLTAIWSDERIATCCVSMRNTDQVRENSVAAARFKPMPRAQIERLRDRCIAAGQTFCADCDGRCARAAGTHASLGDLARLITYHDHYGYRSEARKLYAEMPARDRDWAGADLDAARRACPSQLDFARLLTKVERDLA
jgi:predicted aldo/keto reductase-like oxidoreductase